MNRVNETTKDCLNALIQLRNVPKQAEVRPEHLYGRLRAYIDEALQRGKQTAMSERDLSDIIYAIVASADELAQRKPGEVRDFWLQRPLQLHYFAENIAGDGFFDRLERIIADPRRIEALIVYHLCLQLGFEGRFAVRGGERELDHIKRRVREALGQLTRIEPVSRRHMPPREPLLRRRFDYLILWGGLFAILFAMCFLIVLRITLDRMSSDLGDRGLHVLERFAESSSPSPGKESN